MAKFACLGILLTLIPSASLLPACANAADIQMLPPVTWDGTDKTPCSGANIGLLQWDGRSAVKCIPGALGNQNGDVGITGLKDGAGKSVPGTGNMGVYGNVAAGGSVKAGFDTVCAAGDAGKIRYNADVKDFEGCDGVRWKSFTRNSVRALRYQTFEANLCQRGGNYDVVASCPDGWELVYCSGGPGDQFEEYEYWVLEPDYVNRKCIGHVGQPACYGAY